MGSHLEAGFGMRLQGYADVKVMLKPQGARVLHIMLYAIQL